MCNLLQLILGVPSARTIKKKKEFCGFGPKKFKNLFIFI
jgi:hypothetical protein